MKKQCLLFSCLVLAFVLFSACSGAAPRRAQTTALPETIGSWHNETNAQTKEAPEVTISAEQEENDQAYIQPQKYRHRFYSVPEPFVNLVGEDAYQAWLKTVDVSSNAETMVMMQFVQHFGISRERFDKANLLLAKAIRDALEEKPCIRPMDYTNQEDDEIYNADIIYTFDEEIINAYYLGPDYPYLFDFEFDEAVAAGEYTSQTEEWVDVDEMEAEIIAKYGSLD